MFVIRSDSIGTHMIESFLPSRRLKNYYVTRYFAIGLTTGRHTCNTIKRPGSKTDSQILKKKFLCPLSEGASCFIRMRERPGVLSHKKKRRNRVDLHAFLFVSTLKIERKKKKKNRKAYSNGVKKNNK